MRLRSPADVDISITVGRIPFFRKSDSAYSVLCVAAQNQEQLESLLDPTRQASSSMQRMNHSQGVESPLPEYFHPA
jgi:hypothetical protein